MQKSVIRPLLRCLSVHLYDDCLYLRFQDKQITLSDVPNFVQIYAEVVMNQDMTHTYDKLRDEVVLFACLW